MSSYVIRILAELSGVKKICNLNEKELVKYSNKKLNNQFVTSNLITTTLKWWSKRIERNNYLASPIYGDFIDLGKISIFYSINEILSVQIRKLKKQAKLTKLNIDFYEGKKMIHC